MECREGLFSRSSFSQLSIIAGTVSEDVDGAILAKTDKADWEELGATGLQAATIVSH